MISSRQFDHSSSHRRKIRPSSVPPSRSASARSRSCSRSFMLSSSLGIVLPHTEHPFSRQPACRAEDFHGRRELVFRNCLPSTTLQQQIVFPRRFGIALAFSFSRIRQERQRDRRNHMKKPLLLVPVV